jgi:hypothetical protein
MDRKCIKYDLINVFYLAFLVPLYPPFHLAYRGDLVAQAVLVVHEVHFHTL